MIEIVMNEFTVWDKKKLAQIDEAKKKYNKYKKEGYIITREDKKTPLTRFDSSLEAFYTMAKKIGNHTLKILTDQGDERLVWDKDNGKQAKQAKAKFEELIQKGFSAYSVDSKSQKNKKIEEFDVDAEEILMIPPTVKG